MVSRGGVVGDIEKGAEVGPEGRGELGASIRGDMVGNTMVGDPVMNQGGSTVGGGGGAKWNGCRPAGGAIDDC